MDMTLLDHLNELRRRLLRVLLVFLALSGLCYLWAADIFQFLAAPLAKIAGLHQEGRRMIYTSLSEAFLTYVKVAVFGGMVLSFPFLAHQTWGFIGPGLYQREKRLFLPLLIIAPALFFMGAAFAYYGVVPMAWSFFLNFETGGDANQLPIHLEARVSEYLATVMKLILVFGTCFQLPVIMAVLGRTGIVTATKLRRVRKYAFLVIVIVAALFTPPDFLSPLGLIIPMTLLYEVSILWVRWMGKNGTPRPTSLAHTTPQPSFQGD